MKKTNRTIQIIAAGVIVLTLLLMASIGHQNNPPAQVTAISNPIPSTVDTICSYDLLPQESGLNQPVYIDLAEGKSLDLTFGVNTKFHAECVGGKVRYWIAHINPKCVQDSIILSSDGTWGCNLQTADPYIVAFEFVIGGVWTWPQGMPDEWTEPPLVPLMTPVPTPLGQQL